MNYNSEKNIKNGKNGLVRFKRVLVALLAVFACVLPAALAGCNKNDDDGITVLCTIFPEYDWAKQIVNGVTDENGNQIINVKLLGDRGVDMHSYNPSIADIASIAKCDAFVYVGGESDEKWITSAIKSADNSDMVQIRLFDVLEAKGMLLCEDEHDHEGEDHDHEEACEYDEHVWLSIKNAQAIVDALCEKFCALDGANAQKYKQNASEYNAKLAELDKAYESTVKKATYDTLVFGDRFPFAYLLNDYGIKHDAAFSGCSAESEASSETIIRLARKVDELNLPAIIKIDGATHRIAEQIKETTTNKNQVLIELNSMQSVTKSQIDAGLSYVSVCEQNLTALKTALGVIEN